MALRTPELEIDRSRSLVLPEDEFIDTEDLRSLFSPDGKTEALVVISQDPDGTVVFKPAAFLQPVSPEALETPASTSPSGPILRPILQDRPTSPAVGLEKAINLHHLPEDWQNAFAFMVDQYGRRTTEFLRVREGVQKAFRGLWEKLKGIEVSYLNPFKPGMSPESKTFLGLAIKDAWRAATTDLGADGLKREIVQGVGTLVAEAAQDWQAGKTAVAQAKGTHLLCSLTGHTPTAFLFNFAVRGRLDPKPFLEEGILKGFFQAVCKNPGVAKVLIGHLKSGIPEGLPGGWEIGRRTLSTVFLAQVGLDVLTARSFQDLMGKIAIRHHHGATRSAESTAGGLSGAIDGLAASWAGLEEGHWGQEGTDLRQKRADQLYLRTLELMTMMSPGTALTLAGLVNQDRLSRRLTKLGGDRELLRTASYSPQNIVEEVLRGSFSNLPAWVRGLETARDLASDPMKALVGQSQADLGRKAIDELGEGQLERFYYEAGRTVPVFTAQLPGIDRCPKAKKDLDFIVAQYIDVLQPFAAANPQTNLRDFENPTALLALALLSVERPGQRDDCLVPARNRLRGFLMSSLICQGQFSRGQREALRSRGLFEDLGELDLQGASAVVAALAGSFPFWTKETRGEVVRDLIGLAWMGPQLLTGQALAGEKNGQKVVKGPTLLDLTRSVVYDTGVFKPLEMAGSDKSERAWEMASALVKGFDQVYLHSLAEGAQTGKSLVSFVVDLLGKMPNPDGMLAQSSELLFANFDRPRVIELNQELAGRFNDELREIIADAIVRRIPPENSWLREAIDSLKSALVGQAQVYKNKVASLTNLAAVLDEETSFDLSKVLPERFEKGEVLKTIQLPPLEIPESSVLARVVADLEKAQGRTDRATKQAEGLIVEEVEAILRDGVKKVLDEPLREKALGMLSEMVKAVMAVGLGEKGQAQEAKTANALDLLGTVSNAGLLLLTLRLIQGGEKGETAGLAGLVGSLSQGQVKDLQSVAESLEGLGLFTPELRKQVVHQATARLQRETETEERLGSLAAGLRETLAQLDAIEVESLAGQVRAAVAGWEEVKTDEREAVTEAVLAKVEKEHQQRLRKLSRAFRAADEIEKTKSAWFLDLLEAYGEIGAAELKDARARQRIFREVIGSYDQLEEALSTYQQQMSACLKVNVPAPTLPSLVKPEGIKGAGSES